MRSFAAANSSSESAPNRCKSASLSSSSARSVSVEGLVLGGAGTAEGSPAHRTLSRVKSKSGPYVVSSCSVVGIAFGSFHGSSPCAACPSEWAMMGSIVGTCAQYPICRTCSPLLSPGDDEDPEVDPYEILEMSPFDRDAADALGSWVRRAARPRRQGWGLDPDEIVAKAMDETGSYGGPWTPFE
jgi:hypothetical protein